MSGYDLIGDLHGRADHLKKLLHTLGYSKSYHPDGRKIIFMGDYINRGPKQEETLDMVRDLVASGIVEAALMGNHELSLIRYFHEGTHGFVRPHTRDNDDYHAGFFQEFPVGSKKLDDVVDWMKTLKLYMIRDEFNAVHAYMSEDLLAASRPYLNDDNSLKKDSYDLLDETHCVETFDVFDTLTAGPKYQLPEKAHFIDGAGRLQKVSHLFWWRTENRPEDVINGGKLLCPLMDPPDRDRILDFRKSFTAAARGEKPLFIGHYSLMQDVGLLTPSLACVDYRPTVTAYRWNEGDAALSADRLVCV
jgi:hypothetical protein